MLFYNLSVTFAKKLKMSSKRRATNLTSKAAKKMPKMNEEQANNSSNTKKKLQELKLALDQGVCDSHVLRLIQDIIATTDLPQNLSLRILKLLIKVKCDSVASELLDHQTVDLTTEEGGQVLWKAVNAGNAAIATLLVKAKANLSVRDEVNRTLLHAVLDSCSFKDKAQKDKLARLMMEYGSDVNATAPEHQSVLYQAIINEDCSCELVEELLNRGANVTLNDTKYADDLFWAARRKMTLLPRLIEHQVLDVKTRNQRGVIAIENLISVCRKLTDYRVQMQMIKKILDMGVPVNTVSPQVDRHTKAACPLLCSALYIKKKDLIELLLKYGADVHQKDDRGHTPMYLAMQFKGYTHVSRLLLEAGATIDEQNNDGRYPIHSACENESLRNIHLLLNLGADINVTDHEGYTPFDSLDKTKTTDAGRLVVKHFALIIAKGGTIGKRDMSRLNHDFHTEHYEDCIEELDRMKTTYICEGVPYLSLLSEGTNSLLKLMKNRKIAENFKQNISTLANSFPIYHYMLLHAFEIAEKRYELFLSEPIRVQEGYEGILPDLVIERIAHFARLKAIAEYQREFYMNLHGSLKNKKADTEKIL